MIAPDGLLPLCALAVALGARHGLDADHLAAIDAIARHNAARRPWLARATGALFSVGHGSIVAAVMCAATQMHGRWQTPHWLEASGSAISMVALLSLAFLNLRALRTTPADQVVRLSGLRARLFGRVLAISNPLGITLLGMLFALSFDTVSQAALFGLAARESA